MYYYITRHDEPYALIHLESCQCKNVRDAEIPEKSLDKEIVRLMNSKEVTSYILANDSEKNSLFYYEAAFGSGYSDLVEKTVDRSISDITKKYPLRDYKITYDIIREERYGYGYLEFTGKITGAFYYEFPVEELRKNKIPIDVITGNIVEYTDAFLKDNKELQKFRSYEADIKGDYICIVSGIKPDAYDLYEENIVDIIESIYEKIYDLDQSHEKYNDVFSMDLTDFLKIEGYIPSRIQEFHKLVEQTHLENAKVAMMTSYNLLIFTIAVPVSIPADFFNAQTEDISDPKTRFYPLFLYLRSLKNFGMFLSCASNKKVYLYLTKKIEYEHDDILDDYKKEFSQVLKIDRNFESVKNKINAFLPDVLNPYYLANVSDLNLKDIVPLNLDALEESFKGFFNRL